MEKKVCIVVPIYKANPDRFEQISFIQLCRILSGYTILLLTHENLNLDKYYSIVDKQGLNIKFQIVYFDPDNFESVSAYNDLLLSTNFYQAFKSWEYILIYQLDAFVFSDEVEYWCSRGYAYIGAINHPEGVFSDKVANIKTIKFINFLNNIRVTKYKYRYVGNGGLSLRHVKKTIWLLKIFRKQAIKWKGNEDSFFTYYGNMTFPIYNLAPPKEAMRFSIEHQPQVCLDFLGGSLPFGCHAWYQYHLDFWKPYIVQYGYHLD